MVEERARDPLADASPAPSTLPLDRKRVLLIAPQPFFQWRGASFRARLVAQALIDLGAQVDLLTLPIGDDVDLPGLRVIRAPNILGVRDVRIGPSLTKVAFGFVLLQQARRLIRDVGYDVIHCFEEAGLIGAVLRREHESALVYEKLSDLASYHKGPIRNALLRLYAGFEARAIRCADAIIVGAEAMVDTARIETSGRPIHCIFDAPTSSQPVQPHEVAEVRGRFAAPDDVLAVFVGSFTIYQGIELMFEAMPHVVTAQPNVRFLIIGGSEEEVARWRDWLRERGLDRIVHLVGKLDPERLPAHLMAADVLMLPRLAGTNIPMKVFDYLRAGRAIAATDITANRAVLDESTARFAAPTPGAFSDCVARLAADGELRRRLSQNAQQLARERYDFEAFKRRMAECYAVLGGRPEYSQRRRGRRLRRAARAAIDLP